MTEQDFSYSNTPFHTFDQLFDRSTLTKDRNIGETYKVVGPEEFKQIDLGPTNRYIRHAITGFVSQTGLTGYDSFYAKPSDLLVRLACERTLAIKYDSIFFSAIVHENEVWLYAKNNQIINSGGPIAKIKREDWI